LALLFFGFFPRINTNDALVNSNKQCTKKKKKNQQQQKRGPKSKPQGQNPNMVINGEWNKYVLKHPLVKIYISKKEMKEIKRAEA
jgi:hypothetical protein